MFMNPIPHVNDLQISEYNQSKPFHSSQRSLFNDLSNSEQNSSEDLKNQALSGLTTATHVSKWEVTADTFPSVVKQSPSKLKMHGSRFQSSNSTDQCRISVNNGVRSKLQVDFDRSEIGHGRRSRSFRKLISSYGPTSTCNITYFDETQLFTPRSLCDQENDVRSGPLEPNGAHSVKRRRTHSVTHLLSSHNRKSSQVSSTASSTSMSPIQDLNFDALSDPSEGTLGHPCHESSPVPSTFRYFTSTDDFVVQTPSKSINESDQQSFHLYSPPSGFGNIGGAMNAKSIKALRPRVLFKNSNSLSNKLPKASLYLTPTSPASTLLKVSSQVKKFNAPSTIQPPTQRFSIDGFINQPKSSASDSIALSMAKMTVWNRMSAAAMPMKTSQPAQNPSRQCSNTPRQTSSTTSFKLSHPVEKEPEFTIRRILQMSHGKKWRRFAFGESSCCQIAVQMAHQYLNIMPNKSH